MHLRGHRERNTTSPSCEVAHADKVWIPGGTFRMGSEEFYVEESPVHEVAVDSFWIDRYQVTSEQFARFVAEAGYLTVCLETHKEQTWRSAFGRADAIRVFFQLRPSDAIAPLTVRGRRSWQAGCREPPISAIGERL
jgi:formylglycine-generating enzyme required for sulfatase activity